MLSRICKRLVNEHRPTAGKSLHVGTAELVTSAEMTEALVQINDRLGAAARAGEPVTYFFCECGDCLAEGVFLSLDGYEEIRDREDLIFAPGHEAPRRYRKPSPGNSRYRPGALDAARRDVLIAALMKAGAMPASGTRVRAQEERA